MIEHIFNPGSQEAKAGGSVTFKTSLVYMSKFQNNQGLWGVSGVGREEGKKKKDKITPRVKNFVLNRLYGRDRCQTIFSLHLYLQIRTGCSVSLATGFSVATK